MPRVNDPISEPGFHEQERQRFVDGFRKSKRGNLWRHWDGMTVCVFERDDGLFSWSIADGPEVRFSDECFEEPDEALVYLADELGIGVY